MPNSFAYIALLAWPLLALLFYRRFDALTASFITIVGGYMFLPAATSIDPPLLPALGKDEVAAISALVGCVLIKGIKIHFWGITRLHKFLITILMVIPFVNVFFNTEPVFNGEVFVKGLTPYDAISAVIDQYIFLLPYVIGLSVVKTPNDITKLVNYMILSGLIYSVPALLEIRLSPQLHTWIYGFFPHEFLQQIRMGGYRPVIFMGHGLLVAFFFMLSVCFAFIRLKSTPNRNTNISIFCFLFFVLLLCKTVNVIIWFAGFLFGYYALKYLRVNFFYIAFGIIAFYPIFSVAGLIPHEEVLEFVANYSDDRRSSLALRFLNEVQLITHTQKQWFIGWGGWGRNRLADSVTDSYWLIAYSKYGFFYFISLFALFVVPCIKETQRLTFNQYSHIFYGLTLLMLIILFDQIINASLASSWLWFLAAVTFQCIRMFPQNKKDY